MGGEDLDNLLGVRAPGPLQVGGDCEVLGPTLPAWRGSRTRRFAPGPAGSRTGRARASGGRPGPRGPPWPPGREHGVQARLSLCPESAASACCGEGLAEHRRRPGPAVAPRASIPSRRAAISACRVSGTSRVSIWPAGRYTGLPRPAAPGRAASAPSPPRRGACPPLVARIRSASAGGQPRDQARRGARRIAPVVSGSRWIEAGVAARVPPVRRAATSGRASAHHEEGMAPRPLQQVCDEFQQRRVGPLHVLEDHHAPGSPRPGARRTVARRRTAPRVSVARRSSRPSSGPGAARRSGGPRRRGRTRQPQPAAWRWPNRGSRPRGCRLGPAPSPPAPNTSRPRHRRGSGRGASSTSSADRPCT